MTLAAWLGFLLATFLVSITPGPGFMLSTNSALRGGFRTAFKGILGLQVAILCHILLVALGLGVLLQTSEAAYFALKFIGAAYLVFLGWQSWRNADTPMAGPELATVPSVNAFHQGVLVNLTNPKAILFIAALMPQFIRAGQPLLPQYALIAATTCLVDLLVMCGYAALAARLRPFLADSQTRRWQGRLFGGVFMAAGALLALSGGAA